MQNNTETSRQQILPFGEAGSTCSPEVSPASRFRLQANAREQRMNATCGPKCLEQFGRFVPVGSWARMFSGLLIGRKEWSSNKCALTWKLKGTKSNRLHFRLVPSALPTEGTDAGLLPTVQTQGLKQCEKGKTVFMPLGLLPTPTVNEGTNSSLPPSQAMRKSGIAKMAMQSVESRTGERSRLNPLFIAEMMGFPLTWTVLPVQNGATSPSKPMETP